MKKDIKKSDWVIVRLLVEAGEFNPQQLNRSREVLNSVMYLVNKYGTNKVCGAITLIREERGLK
tara:strand:+ start:309 stop:500 length:192 start_codon:yes stop_codon:yes gene_type:complete